MLSVLALIFGWLTLVGLLMRLFKVSAPPDPPPSAPPRNLPQR